MGFIEKSDVAQLLQDPELVSEISKMILEDADAVDDLAGDIADALSDQLENDAEVRNAIVATAIKSSEFKKRVVRKLAEDLS